MFRMNISPKNLSGIIFAQFNTSLIVSRTLEGLSEVIAHIYPTESILTTLHQNTSGNLCS